MLLITCHYGPESIRLNKENSQVMTWCKSKKSEFDPGDDTSWLNLKNCMLKWDTLETAPHSPEYGSRIQIPVDWNTDAKCPQIDQFLREVLPPDAIDLFFEIAGLMLLRENPFHKAILMLGSGGNGKSVALHVLKSLCGAENVAAVRLQEFSENRFSAACLNNRLANICGDIDRRAMIRTDVFKSLTGGDSIHAERKFGHPFTFQPFALHIFSANEAPGSGDLSEAWFRRWITLPFPNSFRDKPDQKLDLQFELTSDSELEGLLVHAIRSIQDLTARGRFAIPESVLTLGREYELKLDSVAAFVAERCELQPNAWAPRRGLFYAYSNWCQIDGRKSLASRGFYDRLRSKHRNTIVDRRRAQERGFQGIRLKLSGTLDLEREIHRAEGRNIEDPND